MICFLNSYTEIGITFGFNLSERAMFTLIIVVAEIGFFWLLGKAIERKRGE